MKTSLLAKAALVLLTLTATTVVHAQVMTAEDYEFQEGKMEAAAYGHVSSMKKELDVIVEKIGHLQDEAGQQSPENCDEDFIQGNPGNSCGLVKALGEKLDMTDELKKDLTEVAVEMQKQSGDELFKSYDKADKIMKQARKNLADSKKLAELVK